MLHADVQHADAADLQHAADADTDAGHRARRRRPAAAHGAQRAAGRHSHSDVASRVAGTLSDEQRPFDEQLFHRLGGCLP